VVVANGLHSSIFAPDHGSDCTVLTLELQMSGSWQAVASCREEILSRLVAITAGATLKQMLRPNGGFAPSAIWQPGTYRFVLSFFTGGEESSPATQIISATFTIG
jgi:hypothetical protein